MAAHYVRVESLPMLPGKLPVVGHMPRLITNFAETLLAARERFGPLFRIDMGRIHDLVVIADIEGMSLLSNRQASSDVMAQAGGAVLADSILTQDGPPHWRLRSVMQRTFSPRGLDMTTVGGLIAEETQRCITAWRPGEAIHVHRDMRLLTLAILFRMIGCETQDLGEWTTLFSRLNLGALPVPGFPLLATRAQDQLHARLRTIVEGLRRDGEDGTLIGKLVHSADDDGEMLPIDELVPTLRLLVLAGHETSAAAAAWAMLELANHPDFWRRVVDEAATIERPPQTVAELEQTPFTVAFVREVTRRYAPIVGTVRRLTEDVDMLGRQLPANAVVLSPISMLHLDAGLFEDPMTLRPERWLDGGPAPVNGRKLERLSFGLSGPHFCLGYHLALLEITHLVVAVAQRFGPEGRTPSLRGAGLPRRFTFPFTRPMGKADIWIE
ncbi:MAG: cytochrome P450 [Myxococcales bacterium]|nr:cytochrome P450 [Myxococcales bacterium]